MFNSECGFVWLHYFLSILNGFNVGGACRILIFNVDACCPGVGLHSNEDVIMGFVDI